MPLLICPNDETPMQEIDRNGVLIDVCPKCRGIWMDRGELEKLLELVGRREEPVAGQVDQGYRGDRDRPQARYEEPPYREHREHREHDERRYRKRRKFDIFDFFD